ncbi:hypothetical protein DBZ45_16690 [Arthrobacter globiformis]|uniref:SCP domain-containing protein n=1 Tax=Arthrobacter globiformis TaxID=1665 RepID=A0A328HFL1_ARTGO|nr:hypothetical protein DBZ45_16690 [Arthrobacter globiformis]
MFSNSAPSARLQRGWRPTVTLRVVAGIAVAAATIATTAPAAGAAGFTPSSAENVVHDSNQQTIIDTFNGINAFRASKGLKPLTFSVPISAISQKWSDTMAATDTFSHNPDYVTGAPEGYVAASEIIAARWDRSGQGLVDQWINSAPHNAIMSRPDMTTVGIGVAYTDGNFSTPKRYAAYGTANLFRYNSSPAGTYTSPADYFAGRPPLVKPGDLLAIDTRTGVLWDYGNKSATGRKSIFSSGYAPVKEHFNVDWNADGVADILTQWKSGNLSVSFGSNNGTLSAAKVIGQGWGSYDVAVGKFTKTDKYPSIIAKGSDGYLWNYSNLYGTGINGRTLKGSGWNALGVSLLDWDKDGSLDILAKDSAGKLLLYRTDGYGSFKSEARQAIGSGWGSFSVQSIRDYAGAGTQGLIARDASGRLYYYGTGRGAWVPRHYIGAGWLPMNIAG